MSARLIKLECIAGPCEGEVITMRDDLDFVDLTATARRIAAQEMESDEQHEMRNVPTRAIYFADRQMKRLYYQLLNQRW